MLRWRRHLIALGLLFLIGAAIQFPIAFQFVIWPRSGGTPQVNLRGQDASPETYPGPTPRDQPPWPTITHYSEWKANPGFVRIDARHSEPKGVNLNMQVDYVGWPLPVYYVQQMWWPWNDPMWASKAISDPGPRLYWKGVILNPVIFAVSVWWVFILMPIIVLDGIRAARRKRGLCIHCSYPLSPSGLCTECGRSATPSTHAAAPAPP